MLVSRISRLYKTFYRAEYLETLNHKIKEVELDKEVLAIAYNETDDSIYCIGFEDNKDYGIFILNDIEKRIDRLTRK